MTTGVVVRLHGGMAGAASVRWREPHAAGVAWRPGAVTGRRLDAHRRGRMRWRRYGRASGRCAAPGWFDRVALRHSIPRYPLPAWRRRGIVRAARTAAAPRAHNRHRTFCVVAALLSAETNSALRKSSSRATVSSTES